MYSGLRAAVGGIRFVITTPAVWPYVVVPMVVMLLLAGVLGGLGIWGAVRASDALVGEASEGWSRAGSWALTVLLSGLALVLALLVAMALAQPLSGFALEAIAQAQEQKLTGHASAGSSFLAGLGSGLKISLFTLLAGASIFAGLLVLDLLIPPALVLTVPLRFAAGAWLLAWDFLDYPLGLRGLGVRARLRWVLRHKEAVTGFGLTWALLLLIPGSFLLLLPMGVAGATHLVVEGDRQQS
jgi:CysZ protein